MWVSAKPQFMVRLSTRMFLAELMIRLAVILQAITYPHGLLHATYLKKSYDKIDIIHFYMKSCNKNALFPHSPRRPILHHFHVHSLHISKNHPAKIAKFYISQKITKQNHHFPLPLQKALEAPAMSTVSTPPLTLIMPTSSFSDVFCAFSRNNRLYSVEYEILKSMLHCKPFPFRLILWLFHGFKPVYSKVEK